MRKIVTAAIAITLIAGTTAAVPDMYKWIDENGKVHYTDSPPPGKKAKKLDLKINSISGPPVVSSFSNPSPSARAGTVKVKLYTTTWCGYCKKAVAYLRSRGTPFEQLDVENSPQGKREYDALAGRGVPIILVGDRRMDGYDQTTLAAMLDAASL